MGMFDTVLVPCPKCGTESEFQSKGGECMLRTYKLDDCPSDVLSDVNRHSPNICEQCETKFEVELRNFKKEVYFTVGFTKEV